MKIYKLLQNRWNVDKALTVKLFKNTQGYDEIKIPGKDLVFFLDYEETKNTLAIRRDMFVQRSFYQTNCQDNIDKILE